MLLVEGLRHSFRGTAPDRPAIDIAALRAAPGRLTVITGPSGSGKTTLLHLLGGLLQPSAGRIAWSGEDIAKMGETARDRWRHRHAGFVFQNFHLFEDMTPHANVTIAAYFTAFTDVRVRERARNLLAGFGVPDERRRTDSFSRGEQQRIALARALIFDPAIIFADEPTASLDATNAEEVARVLKDLAASGGKTVLAVSHDRAMIEAADQLLRLNHGKLAAPAEIAA